MTDNATTLPGLRRRSRFISGTPALDDEHAIADLICDLGHLANESGFDFTSEIRPGMGIGTRNFMLKTATILDRMP
jgi:hypothetical protein